MTPLLAQFEKVAFKTSKVFLSPFYTFATLDDDLYGTRSSDNQVKTHSLRKADPEGHTADALCDALFRVTYMVRFRRREETQASCVASMIDALLEGRGERHLSGCTVTADWGYGKLSTLTSLFSRQINCILIMPDHILKCHPLLEALFSMWQGMRKMMKKKTTMVPMKMWRTTQYLQRRIFHCDYSRRQTESFRCRWPCRGCTAR